MNILQVTSGCDNYVKTIPARWGRDMLRARDKQAERGRRKNEGVRPRPQGADFFFKPPKSCVFGPTVQTDPVDPASENTLF